jgi:hypothetical protein
MHRRAFIAGAAAVAAAAPLAAKAQSLDPTAGQVVTMRGYLRKVTNYYLVLSPTPQKTDPKSARYTDWPSDCVRVYPKDAKLMPGVTGVVSVKGKIYHGKSEDAFSKTVATVVMTDAIMA